MVSPKDHGAMGEDDRFLAMVIQERAISVPVDKLIAEIERRFPSYQNKIRELFDVGKVDRDDSPQSDPVIALNVDGDVITVIPVDRPLPDGTLDGAITRSSMFWPEAGTQLARHSAHTIVAEFLVGDRNRRVALTAARAVTIVGACIVALAKASGVYWMPAETVLPGSRFASDAQRLSSEPAAIDSWIHFGFMRADNGELACITTGLRLFVGHELEMRPSALQPAQIVQRLIALCAYLISNGPVLKDGETVGLSSAEKIRVKMGHRGQNPRVLVAFLSVERLDAAADVPASTTGDQLASDARVLPSRRH